MAFDVNQLVIDHVLRGIMLDSQGKVQWTLNNIENPSLSVTSESNEKVDALGGRIATFDRAKNGEFSGANSLFDLNLHAAQAGSQKKVASSTEKIVATIFEEIDVTNATSVELKHIPVVADGETYAFKYAYKLNGDGNLGTQFEAADDATTGKFSIDGKVMTFAAGDLAEGDTVLAIYSYEADGTAGNGAVAVDNSGVKFPTAGRFLLEVLCVDTCDPSVYYGAYIDCPKAKLTSDYDFDFTTEGTHPFTIQLMQDYCDKVKRLYTMYVIE